MTVLLFTASHDWETVKNFVPANHSSKPDQLGSKGKVLHSHQILNYSDINLFIYFKSKIKLVRLQRLVIGDKVALQR